MGIAATTTASTALSAALSQQRQMPSNASIPSILYPTQLHIPPTNTPSAPTYTASAASQLSTQYSGGRSASRDEPWSVPRVQGVSTGREVTAYQPGGPSSTPSSQISSRRTKSEIMSPGSEYRCSECGGGFHSWDNLRQVLTRSVFVTGPAHADRYSVSRYHIRNVHGPRRWVCEEEGCGKDFVFEKDLRRHKKGTHDAGREHFCSNPCCYYYRVGFKRREHLTRHQQGSRCPAPDRQSLSSSIQESPQEP
jgi:hypothetical protein